ncbi:MAG: hypothetical protein KGJ74_07220 [Betaproteobacteria bacterium]|nr:hypothetical protein [Betaproteobacteria bacterium]
MKKYLLILVGLWFGIYLAAATFTAEAFSPPQRMVARVLVEHAIQPGFMQPKVFILDDGSKTTAATMQAYIQSAKKTPLLSFWTDQLEHFKPLILMRLWLWVLPWVSLYAAAKLLNMALTVRQLTRQT